MWSKNDMKTTQKLEKSILGQTSRNKLHLNTITLPNTKILQSRYHKEAQAKLKFLSPNQFQRHQHSQLSPQQIVDDLDRVLETGQPIEAFYAVKIVSMTPIYSFNTKPSFSQSDYPLEPHERVNVCEENYFQINNYYNYLYQLAIKQQGDNLLQSNKYISNLITHTPTVIPLQQPSTTHQSQIHEKTSKKQQETIFDPNNVNYNQKKITFNRKEIERLQISKKN